MAGSHGTSAHEILKRLKRLKAHIDKGKETSIHKAAKQYVKSSHFIRVLLKKNVVHVNKDKTIRWNGLAVNLNLAQAIIDEAHKMHTKYLEEFKKNKTGKRPYNRKPAALAVPKANSEIPPQSGEITSILEDDKILRIAKILGADDNGVMEKLVNTVESMHSGMGIVHEDLKNMKVVIFDITATVLQLKNEKITELVQQIKGEQI